LASWNMWGLRGMKVVNLKTDNLFEEHIINMILNMHNSTSNTNVIAFKFHFYIFP